MEKSIKLLSVLFLFLLSCEVFSNPNSYNIIPYPQQLIPQNGKFSLSGKTIILVEKDNIAQINNVNYFTEQLKSATGISIGTSNLQNNIKNCIQFTTNNSIANEGYKLSITSKEITIEASGSAGYFYAIQSLFQLMPSEIYGNKNVGLKNINIPCVIINDTPRFQYRGAHLDVCRHFFPIEFIKKYIDALSMLKINTFHWHLTEDQGWRIEIKRYPKLTEIGSVRERTLIGHYTEFSPQRFDEKPYGGFYTQNQAREIVAYAAIRNITVIPEIEMPGHAMAAIAAYPELSCKQQPIKVSDKWGIFNDVYCTRDTVFNFIENVLDEIISIFPSKSIHIGGDECPKESWKVCPDCQAKIKELKLKDEHELQSYFIQRIEKYLNSKGRQIIGWDEILEGGLAPNATVMSWRGISGGIQAAKEKHNVIMTPGTHCYFDHYQSLPEFEPTAIGGLTPLSKVYDFEPVPTSLTDDEKKYIIGAQANLWTEYIQNEKAVEYMAFPRLSALSEVLWTQPSNKSMNRFMSFMPEEFKRFNAMNINASKAYFSITYNIKAIEKGSIELSLTTDNPFDEIYFTTDGSTPTMSSTKYTVPLVFKANTVIKAQTFEKNKKTGNLFEKEILVSKVTGVPYTSSSKISNWYAGNGANALTDGNLGITNTYSQWIAFVGENNREIVFDLNNEQEIKKVSAGMLHSPFLKAFYCTKITVQSSSDNINFSTIAEKSIAPLNSETRAIIRPELEFTPIKTRYVKLIFENNPALNKTNHSESSLSLYLDEICIW